MSKCSKKNVRTGIKIVKYLAVAAWILFWLNFKLTLVSGHSMEPTIHDGDILLASNIYNIEDQDIVLVDTKEILGIDSIIKRYYEDKSNDTEIWVEGDNKEHSTDSRVLGTFARDRVMAKAVFNISQFSFIE